MPQQEMTADMNTLFALVRTMGAREESLLVAFIAEMLAQRRLVSVFLPTLGAREDICGRQGEDRWEAMCWNIRCGGFQ